MQIKNEKIGPAENWALILYSLVFLTAANPLHHHGSCIRLPELHWQSCSHLYSRHQESPIEIQKELSVSPLSFHILHGAIDYVISEEDRDLNYNVSDFQEKSIPDQNLTLHIYRLRPFEHLQVLPYIHHDTLREILFIRYMPAHESDCR